MKYNQTEAETEAKTMTESDLQHAINCAHDCNVGYQAEPYQAELTRRERQARQDNEIANACVAALGDRGAQQEDIFANSTNLFKDNDMKIYCYVTNESCLLKTAAPDDEIFGRPVSECGDYDAWTLDQNETNELVLSSSGYRRRAACAVQKEMGWAVQA